MNGPCPTRATRPVAAVAALVAAAGLLTGCGLRLETPTPGSSTPDVNESARQRASADALAIEVLAATPDADPAGPGAAIRATVIAQAQVHLDQLGGVYGGRPGAAIPTVGPTAAVTSTGAPSTPTPAAVLTLLTQAAADSRADALVVPDGALARLLASVSTARLLLARLLATAAGLPGPDLPGLTAPAALPLGVTPSVVSTLVAAEDEAGYGFEVIAAKLSGGQRSSALARARVHRDRAQDWATLASIARTGFDPRRTAYALPGGLADPAVATTLARTLEQSLADDYASLVADADPGSRSPLIDALADASSQAATWGAPAPAFPGLPERVVG